VAGSEGSNPARGIDLCQLCLYVELSYVGRGLCDGLITRPEESYRVSSCMCDHRNPARGPRKMNDSVKSRGKVQGNIITMFLASGCGIAAVRKLSSEILKRVH
jgi:hypothetical protein